MDLPGLLILLYVLANILGILLSNRLFAGFVAAKPEGRKTAIADKFISPYSISFTCRMMQSLTLKKKITENYLIGGQPEPQKPVLAY